MVGFAVLVGVALVYPNNLFSFPSVLGFFTGFFISGFSMVLNDYYDIEVDSINMPDRLLPSKKLSPNFAITLALILLFVGIFLSYLTSFYNFVIAISFAFIAWLYNSWGKRKGIIGNFMVAASVSIPYIYGSLIFGFSEDLLLLWLVLTSFLAATGREIVKTISDIVGDELRNVMSIARVYGPKSASIFSSMLFLMSVIVSWFPFFTGLVGIFYALFMLIPSIIFIYSSIKILNFPSKLNALHVKNISLLGMLLGLIAFLIGGLTFL